jgi:HD domain
MDTQKFNKVREDLIDIFPLETDEPRLQYVRRTWVFPNHIDVAVDFARQMAEKYKANAEIAMLGALLHDAGLAYKRESASPAGHEEHSIEYAQEFLPNYGYGQELIDEVVKCIAATEPKVEPATLEAKIVRSGQVCPRLGRRH